MVEQFVQQLMRGFGYEPEEFRSMIKSAYEAIQQMRHDQELTLKAQLEMNSKVDAIAENLGLEDKPVLQLVEDKKEQSNG